jgi:hypothetical protein
MSEDSSVRTYEGRTVIVPLDVADAASVAQLEEKVRGLVDGIGEDEEIYVRPKDGGDAVEVSVLSPETHTP